MEKLEKGYTKEDLSAFMQEAFKAHKRVRRNDDGSWETQPAKPDIVGTTASVSTVSTVSTEVDDVEKKPEKKGAWKRFKSLFVKSKNASDASDTEF